MPRWLWDRYFNKNCIQHCRNVCAKWVLKGPQETSCARKRPGLGGKRHISSPHSVYSRPQKAVCFSFPCVGEWRSKQRSREHASIIPSTYPQIGHQRQKPFHDMNVFTMPYVQFTVLSFFTIFLFLESPTVMLSAGSFSSPYEHLSQPETKRMVEHYTAYLSDNTRLIANPGLKVCPWCWPLFCPCFPPIHGFSLDLLDCTTFILEGTTWNVYFLVLTGLWSSRGVIWSGISIDGHGPQGPQEQREEGEGILPQEVEKKLISSYWNECEEKQSCRKLLVEITFVFLDVSMRKLFLSVSTAAFLFTWIKKASAKSHRDNDNNISL